MLTDTPSESRFCPGQLQPTYNFRIRSSICQMSRYQCKTQHRGTLLSLPLGGFHENILRTKGFEDYIRDNVDNWFRWSRKMKLPVEHMEDLILVTGRTLAKSWAAAVFDGHMSSGTLAPRQYLWRPESPITGGVQFIWHNVRGSVEYHNSRFNPVRSPGYVFSP